MIFLPPIIQSSLYQQKYVLCNDSAGEFIHPLVQQVGENALIPKMTEN
jgi:hypothetical protein